MVSLNRRAFRLWLSVALLACLWPLYMAIGEWSERHAFMINISESLPNWAFFVTATKNVRKGDIVFFIPPRSEVLAVHFAGDKSSFGKHILGVEGQHVSHREGRVFIDGKQIAQTKRRTSKGIPLTLGPQGIIPEDCFYVGTSHPDGFDSRYAQIGFVCQNQILGKGRAIL